MWNRIAAIHERDGALAEASAAWEAARSLHRLVDDAPDELEALEGLARCTRKQSDRPEAAIPLYEQAITLAAARGEQHREGSLRNQLGIVEWERGAYGSALRQYEVALRIFRDLGDRVHEGLMLNSLGLTLCRLQRHDEARTVLEQGLTLNRKTGERLLEAHSLAALADVYLGLGRLGEAAVQYEQALAIRRAMGDQPGEERLLQQLARLRSAPGPDADAARCAHSDTPTPE